VKKLFLLCLTLILGVTSAFADLGVDRDELKKAKDVNFVNYTGPYDKVDTLEEIRNIGVVMGKDFQKASRRSTYLGRFSIIHVYDPADTSGKFDADIFVIEPGSFIDHVRNIRTVLAGYLQTAYGYNQEDALLLARFITLYNAVFRGNITYFKSVYKDKVMENVSAADAGLALTYKEWPGHTKVLIPLSEGFAKGKISSLDAQKLTQDEVKDALRREDSKGIEDRKKIVDLQEKQLEEKQKDIIQDKKNLEEEKKKLEEDKKELAKEKALTGETESTRKKEEAIKKKEEENKKTEAEIAKREEALAKSETVLAKDREEIAKEDRALTENKNVTAALDTASSEKGLFLKVQSGNENEAGEVVLYNFLEAKILARSQGLRVKERKIHIYADSILVVAEADGKPGAFLMYLDGRTLAVSKQSQEEIFKNTKIEMQANALYAVIKRGSQYFLGLFDTTLTLKYKSSDEVIPATPLSVWGPYIYVQAKSGLILRLSITDLTTKDTADAR
jgi:hypothetical protein